MARRSGEQRLTLGLGHLGEGIVGVAILAARHGLGHFLQRLDGGVDGFRGDAELFVRRQGGFDLFGLVLGLDGVEVDVVGEFGSGLGGFVVGLDGVEVDVVGEFGGGLARFIVGFDGVELDMVGKLGSGLAVVGR